MQFAELKPGLPGHLFTAPPSVIANQEQTRPRSAISAKTADDEFGADEIDDQDLVNVGEQRCRFLEQQSIEICQVESQDFRDIETLLPTEQSKFTKEGREQDSRFENTAWTAEKLNNGKWACNHKCKDKAV